MPPVEQIPPAQLKQDVDNAVSSNNFAHVFDELQQAEKGKSPQQQATDLDQYRHIINAELQNKGFPEINLTMDEKGQMHVQDSQGQDIDPQHFAEKPAQAQTEKSSTPSPGQSQTDQVKDSPKEPQKSSTDAQSQYWTDHERQDNPDGSSDLTVKQGDSLWRIAQNLCEQKLGHKMDPKNHQDMQAVLKMTNDLAKANPDHPIDAKTGRALIKDGDTIHVPAELKTKPADATQTPGDKDKTPGDPANPEKATAENVHAGNHGKVEVNGNTTKITEDDGAQATVTTDDQGNPVEVNLQGGHWAKDNHEGDWKKTGDHQWTSDQGTTWKGDITVGKDGSYTATQADGQLTEKYHPNGSSETIDGTGKPTKIESADGPHQHTYTKDSSGKWTAQPGNEQFDDVTLGDDGTVTAKIGNTTKNMYPDGAQVDTDEKGNTTFVQTADGPHQISYAKGEDNQFTSNPGGEKFNDVKMDSNGDVTATYDGGQKHLYADGRQVDTDSQGNDTFIQSPNGDHQESYLKDSSTGKWHSNPGNEELTDVKMDDKGNVVTSDAYGMTKNHYVDGSQVDTDSHDRMTYMRTKDGVQYNLTYNTDESTVPQGISDSNGNYYNLESEGKYYNLNGNPERLKVQVTPGSISIEGAKGKSVVTAGNGGVSDTSDDE